MQDFQNSKDRPFIHLVDGGLADNIGVRAVLLTLEELAVSAAFRSEVHFGAIQRVVLIVVNARSSPRTEWDHQEKPPGSVNQLLQASSLPIERYTFETVETMKDRAEVWKWRRELLVARARLAGETEEEADTRIPKVSFHVIEVSFEAISDPEKRAYFMNLPTSFVLPAEDIDRIKEVAGMLLRHSSYYEIIVKELGGSSSE